MRDFDDFDEIEDEDFDFFNPFTHPLLDDPDKLWYGEFDFGDCPICEFGVGDSDGLCTREFSPCYNPACPWADE